MWRPNVKPNGIQAFNTANGALVWERERFKKGITNAVVLGDQFAVCSGKYNKADLHSVTNDRRMLQTDKSDIACFDLVVCTFKQFNARKGASSGMSAEGNFVYVYDKKNGTKPAMHLAPVHAQHTEPFAGRAAPIAGNGTARMRSRAAHKDHRALALMHGAKRRAHPPWPPRPHFPIPCAGPC